MSVGFTTGPIIGDPDAPGYTPSGAFDTAEFGPGVFGREYAQAILETGVDPNTGMQVMEPAPNVSADALNAKYGIPGELAFKNDAPDEVGRMLYDAKREELARQDAAARRPPGLMSGAATLGAGFIASALDPVNLAASLIPGVGQARWALAAERAAGPVSRAAIRFGAGAAAGAQAQIPLTALRYGLSQQQQADYSATDALLDAAYGTLLGGGLHAGFGAAGDVLGARFGASPEAAQAATSLDTREAALRTSLAQLADGRRVDVQPIFDAAPPGLPAAGMSDLQSRIAEAGDAYFRTPDPAAEDRLAGALRAVAADPDPAMPAIAAAADDAEAARPVADESPPTEPAPGDPTIEGERRSPSLPVEPEIAAAEAGQQQAAGYARAFAQAAQCLIGGIV